MPVVTAYKNKAVEQQALIMQTENSVPPVDVRNVVADTASVESISDEGGNVKYSVEFSGQTKTDEFRLARTKGNANSLAIVHIDELLQTATNYENSDENSHQWLDQNGRNKRKAYMQDRAGKIFETTLNIAKARDGRKILYALSNIKQIDEGVVPSAHNNERGSHTNRLSVDNSISDEDGKVKHTLIMQLK